MEQLFKHLAVRLWTSVVVGGIAALVVLHPFAAAVGPAWMIAPGIGLLAGAFWLTGAAFAAMGRRRLTHLLKEATVWDRAGMSREAAHALGRAWAIVDSYLFSPLSRKEPAGHLLAKTARFQIAQDASEASADAVIGAYLQHFPTDRVAAVKWLDGVLAGRAVTQRSHDIAARIGAAHPDDAAVQRMLTQFYLAERRCDFAALQTYRCVLDAGEPLPGNLLGDLADLFLAQPRVDSLALAVYLDAHAGRNPDPRLLPAIAACCRAVRPSPVTAALLDRAGKALDGIDPARCEAMASAFLPETPAHRRLAVRRRPARPRQPITARLGGLVNRFHQYLSAAATRLRALRQATLSGRARAALKWASLGLVAVGVGFLVVNTAMHLAADIKPVEKPPEPVAAPITDPFTLQVAAYLKEADARRYVEQLKGQGLDAYWTRASGAGKTWYQVRIAHYKTKADARAVGEDLKNRRLIGDYYVANYKRPDIP